MTGQDFPTRRLFKKDCFASLAMALSCLSLLGGTTKQSLNKHEWYKLLFHCCFFRVFFGPSSGIPGCGHRYSRTSVEIKGIKKGNSCEKFPFVIGFDLIWQLWLALYGSGVHPHIFPDMAVEITKTMAVHKTVVLFFGRGCPGINSLLYGGIHFFPAFAG